MENRALSLEPFFKRLLSGPEGTGGRTKGAFDRTHTRVRTQAPARAAGRTTTHARGQAEISQPARRGRECARAHPGARSTAQGIELEEEEEIAGNCSADRVV